MIKQLLSMAFTGSRRGSAAIARDLRMTRSPAEIDALLKRVPFDIQNDRV